MFISSKEVCLNQTGLESSCLTLVFVIMMVKQLPLIVNYHTPGTIPNTWDLTQAPPREVQFSSIFPTHHLQMGKLRFKVASEWSRLWVVEAGFELRTTHSRVKSSSNSRAGVCAQEQPRKPRKEGGIEIDKVEESRGCKQVDVVQIVE